MLETKTISIPLPEDTWEQVEAICKELDIKTENFVARAILEYSEPGKTEYIANFTMRFASDMLADCNEHIEKIYQRGILARLFNIPVQHQFLKKYTNFLNRYLEIVEIVENNRNHTDN